MTGQEIIQLFLNYGWFHIFSQFIRVRVLILIEAKIVDWTFHKQDTPNLYFVGVVS